VKDITSNKFFIPGFAVAVTLIVVLILVFFRGGVPSNAVAVAGGDPILKSDFNKTMAIFASQSHVAGAGAGKPVIPDPPNFTNCIAGKRRTAPKNSTDAILKKQCSDEYNTAKTQIMTALIQSKWYSLEAKDRGINISDAEVKQRFLPLKQQTFPKEADYQKFLKSTGQTEADLLKLVKNQIIQEKIRASVGKAGQPTARDIETAYNKNKSQYAQPATRDLLVVFNSKKPQADAALAALRKGTSFATVAKKFSQDSASKAQGGKFPGVTKGQFEPALDKAVFGAKIGALVGPIKTQFGYYLFKATKATVAKQQSLQQATPQIKQTLISTSQQKAFDDFQKNFKDKWRKKTKCAAGFLIDLCKNGPTPKNPTAATGAPGG
jgi:foldase protein PrsA